MSRYKKEIWSLPTAVAVISKFVVISMLELSFISHATGIANASVLKVDLEISDFRKNLQDLLALTHIN